jgi:argininosuccinate lyase
VSRTGGSTGRIEKPLNSIARRILFERDLGKAIDTELPDICRIDFAHLLMLAERGIVDAGAARQLLRAIQRLVRQQFAPLTSGRPLRGLFLMYEQYLIEVEGARVGGLLQTARSRNDLNATLLRMRLRRPFASLLQSAFRVEAILMRRALDYADVVMPAYTHGQAAEPISYGHYLGGVAEALRRDIESLLDAGRELDMCPLGAGAVAGTAVPIDPTRTAELLGFARPCPNSVDAVASRDVALRVLAAGTIYGTTLSRAATDLLQWLTAEFQFLSLPDELVGSSSAMPQKRNPFLLEHVQGRTASVLGAFTAAVSASRNVPFTNAIPVGTESIRPVWNALDDMTDAGILFRLVVSQARPRPEQMLQRATNGFTNATAIATRAALENGMDFRSAHHLVGTAVTEAIRRGIASLEELCGEDERFLNPGLTNGMDPASCVRRARYGGGPAPDVLRNQIAELKKEWLRQFGLMKDKKTRWKTAERKLEDSLQAFCGPN